MSNLGQPRWSSVEIATAASIYQRHFVDIFGDDVDGPPGARLRVFERIADATGRTVKAIENRFLLVGASFNGSRAPSIIQAYALADVEARLEASQRRDLTAEIFGDPPPGYSALDKRRARVST